MDHPYLPVTRRARNSRYLSPSAKSWWMRADESRVIHGKFCSQMLTEQGWKPYMSCPLAFCSTFECNFAPMLLKGQPMDSVFRESECWG